MPLKPKPYGGGREQPAEDKSFLESAQRAQEYLRKLSAAEERIAKQEAVHAEFVQQLAARLESAEREVAGLAAELHGRQLKTRRKRRTRPVPAEEPTPT
jgi:predicted nucleic acid-binding protein